MKALLGSSSRPTDGTSPFVAETSGHVEIWTAAHADGGAQACAAYLVTGSSTIHLAADLGHRDLLHAPVSDDWKLYIDNF